MRARIRVWDLSEDQIDNLEKFALSTNEIDLRTGHGLSGSFDVLAPFDGYVHMKKAVEGMRFEAGPIAAGAGRSQPRLDRGAVSRKTRRMYVNVGQKMTVTFPSMPQHKVQGEISFIDPHVDEAAAPHHGADRHLGRGPHVPSRPFRRGFRRGTGRAKASPISTGAVVPTGNKYIVFVDHGGGKLEPRQIEVGTHSGDYYEVVSGLNEGDRVVSSANFLIDAESRIQGVLKTWGDRP